MNGIENNLFDHLNQFNPFAYRSKVNALQQKLKSFPSMGAYRKSALIVSYLHTHVLPARRENNLADIPCGIRKPGLRINNPEPKIETRVENKAFCEAFALYIAALLY